MDLANLPTEVLAQILGGTLSWAAIELWQTGSQALAAKLKNGGIKDVALDAHQDAKPNPWPRCLKEFKLSSLSLCSRQPLVTSLEDIRKELRQLDSGLTELILDFTGAVDVIFPTLDKEPELGLAKRAAAVKPVKRAKNQESSNSSAQHIEAWDLNRTFPDLQRLVLGNGLTHPTHLSAHVLTLLPQSLTSLVLPCASSLACNALPPRLTMLNSPYGSVTIADLPKLPKNLTEVENAMDQETFDHLLLNSHLLPNLKDLRPNSFDYVPVDYYAPQLPEWPLNVLTAAVSPPQREVVEEDETHLYEDLSERLPPKAEWVHFACPLTPKWLAEVPPSTTSLSLSQGVLDWSQAEIGTRLFSFSNLVELSISNDFFFGAQHCHLLPRTLKSLNVCNITILTDLQAKKLTDQDSLAQGVKLIQGDDQHLWSSIKAELIKINPNTRSAATLHLYFDLVESGALYGLPLGLTRLDINGRLHQTHWSTILPPKIAHLQLNDMNAFANSNFFDHLPPFLRYLDVRLLDALDGDELSIWKIPANCPSFSNMQHLTEIRIKLGATKTAKALLNHLPRNLLDLELDVPKASFTAANLETLPRHLQHLVLFCQSVKPANAWLHALPRTLTYLATSPTLEGSDLKNCPASLTTLIASARRISVNDVLALPRRLGRFMWSLPRGYKTLAPDDLAVNPLFASVLSRFIPLWRLLEHSEAEVAEMLQIPNQPPQETVTQPTKRQNRRPQRS